MKIVFTALVLAVLLLVPGSRAIAQSPEMPIPALVLKDADGKPMAQVVDVELSDLGGVTGYGTYATVTVVFNFDGTLAFFSVTPVSNDGFENNRYLYFTSNDCTGQPYTTKDITFNTSGKPGYVILGPDPDLGTFRVFRSTQQEGNGLFFSRLDQTGAGCIYGNPGISALNLAEEVVPNPLEGFHGRTDTHPERRLIVEGGTRLP